MKKFINEYKALRSKSETETSTKGKHGTAVESPPEMGVFKWLRRERVTVSISSDAIPTQENQESPDTAPEDPIGTIRTEEYKRDLAEFQARRSVNKDTPERPKVSPERPELPETPVKKKCARHSLPVSCTDCASPNDKTFNYEKKSAVKYKKKHHKRTKSVAEDKVYETLPNIQFLFQNQVFMPGLPRTFVSSYSEPQRTKRNHRKTQKLTPEIVQKQIDFDESQERTSLTPEFYKNNSLPVDPKHFLEGSKSDVEEVDGVKVGSSPSSEEDSNCKRGGDDKGKDSDEKLWEVMSELKNLDRWADEQLRGNDTSRSDDGKSDVSTYGLPVASACNLNVESYKDKVWNKGKWGVVPVQVKKLSGVTLSVIKKKQNTEVNLLRKFRHPNIILLMGLYSDFHSNTHIICEQCLDSLYGILHIQGRILSAQTSVRYALDIASALVFLRMQGYILTALNSQSIMITANDSAKLVDLSSCMKLARDKPYSPKQYDMYSPEPQYVNIDDTRSITMESEPLLSKHSSETYLATNSVAKEYAMYRESDMYRWQAPELFEPNEMQLVYPCLKSGVYSLCLILWECCNAAVPWKTLTYDKLKELYTLWKTGIRLPQDGTYPGSLLSLLQSGLAVSRDDRIDLNTLHSQLVNVKCKLEDLEYIIIPARKKKSNFSSVAWDNSPTDDSECLSPIIVKNVYHKAVVHKNSSPDTSEKDAKSDSSPMYETIRKDRHSKQLTPEKCYISEDEPSDEKPILQYEHLQEREISSACSTPIAKIRARIKDMETPNTLHRSDSTEYCSILSPENRYFAINEDSNKDSAEKATAKLSRSFTPKSYKPLHIKVPEFQLDSVKPILKESSNNGTYKFDVKNYSLPTTPIARSNKLRRNAWLSGDLGATERMSERLKGLRTPKKNVYIEPKEVQSAPETPANVSNDSSLGNEHNVSLKGFEANQSLGEEREAGTDCLDRDSFTGLRKVDRPSDYSPETESSRDRTGSWPKRPVDQLLAPSFSQPPSQANRAPVDDEGLANVNVKPLVAIHERWIYEANRKTGRSLSLPENQRSSIPAVKPASHCVDTLRKSLPQLSTKKPSPKPFRAPPSPGTAKSGSQWDNFCQAREAVAKNINFGSRDHDRFRTWGRDNEKCTSTEGSPEPRSEKVDQATDTRSIEEFIRDLIRKEFQHILHEISDDSVNNNEDTLTKGIANIVENLKSGDSDKKDVKSFSRVKINGNNKPLLQITFTRSGENSLQVLDNCVNVTICDNYEREKPSEDVASDDVQVHSLKRCQAFDAIQEARSTEDLYIDDELSSQASVNFGRVSLLPLHGSLHEVLCARRDRCCLLQLRREHPGTTYLRYDNSDTESHDAVDGSGSELTQDTVVYKRSISVIEERVQRTPRDANTQVPLRTHRFVETSLRMRPKSEVLQEPVMNHSTRARSASSPALSTPEDTSVQVNIDNVASYDSSSEECLQCRDWDAVDDFEILERSIEADLTRTSLAGCACLGKISEENLSAAEEGQENHGN